MVPQERKPALQLVRFDRPAGRVSRHGGLRDLESELQQFPVEPRCTPAVLGHQADQIANLPLDPRSPGTAAARDLRPVASEPFSAPPRDGVGVDEEEATRPTRPGRPEGDPEGTVDIVEHGTGRSRLSAKTCCRRARFSTTSSERASNTARTTQATSQARNASSRSMGESLWCCWSVFKPFGERCPRVDWSRVTRCIC